MSFCLVDGPDCVRKTSFRFVAMTTGATRSISSDSQRLDFRVHDHSLVWKIVIFHSNRLRVFPFSFLSFATSLLFCRRPSSFGHIVMIHGKSLMKKKGREGAWYRSSLGFYLAGERRFSKKRVPDKNSLSFSRDQHWKGRTKRGWIEQRKTDEDSLRSVTWWILGWFTIDQFICFIHDCRQKYNLQLTNEIKRIRTRIWLFLRAHGEIDTLTCCACGVVDDALCP